MLLLWMLTINLTIGLSQQGSMYHLIKEYGEQKLKEACYGAKPYRIWRYNHYQAEMKCNAMGYDTGEEVTNEEVVEEIGGTPLIQQKKPFQQSSEFGNEDIFVQVLRPSKDQASSQNQLYPQQSSSPLVQFLEYVQHQTDPKRESYPLYPSQYPGSYNPSSPPVILSKPADTGYTRHQYYRPYHYDSPMYYFGQQNNGQYSRKKRAVTIPTDAELAEYEKQKVMKIQQKEENEIRSLKCILTEMGYMDPVTEKANLDYTKSEITMLEMDPALKNRLLAVIDGCYEVAMNYPSSLLFDLDTNVELGRSLKFFKCTYKKSLKVCLKHQLASKLGQ